MFDLGALVNVVICFDLRDRSRSNLKQRNIEIAQLIVFFFSVLIDLINFVRRCRKKI
jgi:hypothetical protein